MCQSQYTITVCNTFLTYKLRINFKLKNVQNEKELNHLIKINN